MSIEERKQHIREYQHTYYLEVTKNKRKLSRNNPDLLEKEGKEDE